MPHIDKGKVVEVVLKMDTSEYEIALQAALVKISQGSMLLHEGLDDLHHLPPIKASFEQGDD